MEGCPVGMDVNQNAFMRNADPSTDRILRFPDGCASHFVSLLVIGRLGGRGAQASGWHYPRRALV
jgi:hypothetical protein